MVLNPVKFSTEKSIKGRKNRRHKALEDIISAAANLSDEAVRDAKVVVAEPGSRSGSEATEVSEALRNFSVLASGQSEAPDAMLHPAASEQGSELGDCEVRRDKDVDEHIQQGAALSPFPPGVDPDSGGDVNAVGLKKQSKNPVRKLFSAQVRLTQVLCKLRMF